MKKPRRVNPEDLHATICELIKEGIDTSPMLCDRLKLNRTYLNRVLGIMTYKGKIYKHEEITSRGRHIYYRANNLPSHDPFNLTGRAYETHQPSTAAH
jgi:hypothetical protein